MSDWRIYRLANQVKVNVGLTLEGMTDGLCKANVHRVVFPTPIAGELPRDRKSIAYFSTPSHDVVMNAVKPGGVIMKTQGKPGFPTKRPFCFCPYSLLLQAHQLWVTSSSKGSVLPRSRDFV